MNISQQTKARAKRVIFADKMASPSQVKQALRLEIARVLADFMDISPEQIKISVAVQNSGNYHIEISATTAVIHSVGILPN